MPVPTVYPFPVQTDPAFYLRGPIASNKKLSVTCPGCGHIFVLWSPTLVGVLVCQYCNTRLRW